MSPKLKQIPMSGKNLEKYVDGSKIYLLEELKGKTLNKLLPKEIDYIIILFETVDHNNGHWTSLMKYPNKHGETVLEFFDSYGNTPKGVYNFNTSRKNKYLDQDKNYLSILIKNYIKLKPKTIFVYNKYQFQSYNEDIATCGRWVIYRILSLTNKNMRLKTFTNFYQKLKLLFENETNDELVSLIVN